MNAENINQRIEFLEFCLKADPEDYLAEFELTELKNMLKEHVTVTKGHLTLIKGGKQ